MDEITILKDRIDKARATLITFAPFLSRILSKVRILATNRVPLAACDIKSQILINPEAMNKMRFEDFCFILQHECIHAAFRHPQRGLNKHRHTWNIAADAISNSIVSAFLKCTYDLKRHLVTPRTIAYIIQSTEKQVERMTVEEIYRLLPKIEGRNGRGEGEAGAGREGKGAMGGSPIEDDLQEQEGTGEIIQKGDEELYNGKSDEITEKWRDVIAEAAMAQKLIGTLPLGVKRLVDRYLASKLPWNTLIRQAVIEGVGKTISSTWRRRSRKIRGFPGQKRLTHPTIHVAVDCSGSMSKQELSAIAAELFSLVKFAPLRVSAWDTRRHKVTLVKNVQELRRNLDNMWRGYGGTCIKPVLEDIEKEMKMRDIVVIFSDAEIFDWRHCLDLFDKIALRASIAIFVTTHRTLPINSWRWIKLEV